MEIKILVLGELQTNCYIVYDQNTKQGIIIDPADDANFISEQILSLKIIPTGIYATHGHFDHLLAADELQMAFNIPFYVHEKDLFLVKNLAKNAAFWTKRKVIEKPPKEVRPLRGRTSTTTSIASQGDALRSWQAQIIWTPGHTPGSVCLYFPKEGILFSGDTLFADGVGRTDLSYSSSKDLQKSLKKLSKLPQETKIYPGHGEISTLGEVLSKLHSNTPVY